jgi:hypothetical protein
MKRAKSLVEDQINNFVGRVVEQLKVTTGRLPKLTRINLWDAFSSGTPIERFAYDTGLVNTIALVHSLDMSAADIEPSVFSSSGAFVPSYDVQGKSR